MFIPKGPEKGNVVWNYRPIAYLNLSWKLLIGIIAEEIYDHLNQQNILLHEQKEFKGISGEAKDQFLVNKSITLQ